ncbi:MAG: A24 family peptidase [Pirellulales bacterium]|nr:A24 family peptidase [Pirellulales bacterium]
MFLLAVAAFTATAAITDIRYRRIPNYLTVPVAAAGLVFHTLHPQGFGLFTAAAGLLVGFALLLAPALMGGSGMGDVKLLAALGAWLGPKLTLVAFAVSIGLAALLAIGMLIYVAVDKGVLQMQRRIGPPQPIMSYPARRVEHRLLPFAVPVALGAWLILAWSVLTQGL